MPVHLCSQGTFLAQADGLRCPVGQAVCTPSAGRLAAKYREIVHTVAPFYGEGGAEWRRQLLSCYHSGPFALQAPQLQDRVCTSCSRRGTVSDINCGKMCAAVHQVLRPAGALPSHHMWSTLSSHRQSSELVSSISCLASCGAGQCRLLTV